MVSTVQRTTVIRAVLGPSPAPVITVDGHVEDRGVRLKDVLRPIAMMHIPALLPSLIMS